MMKELAAAAAAAALFFAVIGLLGRKYTSIAGASILDVLKDAAIAGIVFLVSETIYSAFSHYQENRANNLAIGQASVEELKGGRRLVQAAQRYRSDEMKNASRKKMVFLFLKDIYLSNLCKKVETALQEEGESLEQTPEENDIIDALHQLFIELQV
jgi:hypothetical protein